MAIDINIPSQVKNYANLAAFPATGSLKTIFIAEDTNKTYRWTGSVYVEISGTDTSSLVPTSRTLTINGTTQDLSADRTFTISTGITIGTTAITSGTVGRVLFEGAGNVVSESANLFWDNTNARLGIGTSSPTQPLEVVKNQNATTKINISNTTSGTASTSELSLTSDATSGFFNVGKLSTTITPYKIFAPKDGIFYNAVGGDISILNDASNGKIKFTAGAISTAQMTLFANGNLAINTTTDAGFKLDVNGTARVSGPSTYSMVYDSNGILNLNGTYARLDLFNQSGSLRARLNCDGPNGTLTLCQNASGYIFLNGAQSGNNSFIATALSIGNQSAANASSILDLTSTTKGFLPPRMTTTQKNAIASPATGLMVYDTTLNLISVYNGTTWITL
jgi:hypothetical protein